MVFQNGKGKYGEGINMDEQQKTCIVEILKNVGVYERSRSEVSSDQELAILFDQDFDQLIEQVMNKEKPS